MKRILFTSIVLFLYCCSVFAQNNSKLWTIEECIRYAIDNNIDVKRQHLQTRVKKNSLDLSKTKLLPTLSASGSENISWGRSLDQTTYQFTDQKVISNSFSLSSGMTIFEGLRNYNSIKENEYEFLASEQNLENTKENISLSVARCYLQILLCKELVSATEKQFQITLQQIEKTRSFVEAGRLAHGDLLQIEAQAAQEEALLITAKNQLYTWYLDLTQLLELPTPEGFEVATPAISIDVNAIMGETVENIFLIASGLRPSVKSSELRLKASEYNLKAVRGMRFPSLSMGYSVSSIYSDIRRHPVTAGDYPFIDQLKDNRNRALYFTLRVPIFNGWQTNKNIANSKINIDNNQYALYAEKKTLYRNIQQAHADASAALKRYEASQKAVTSMEESFMYSEQKFDVGLITPVDYNVSKNSLLKAQSDLVQAKYEYIFKTKILDFYSGIPIKL